jgi:hypothetical protein
MSDKKLIINVANCNVKKLDLKVRLGRDATPTGIRNLPPIWLAAEGCMHVSGHSKLHGCSGVGCCQQRSLQHRQQQPTGEAYAAASPLPGGLLLMFPAAAAAPP